MKKLPLWELAFWKAANQRPGQPNPLNDREVSALLAVIRREETANGPRRRFMRRQGLRGIFS